jgi:hypothetical protein
MPGSDGTVRASYRPTGFNNDDQNNIVHVESWTSGFVWVPWALAVVFIGIVVIQPWRWRRGPNRIGARLPRETDADRR